MNKMFEVSTGRPASARRGRIAAPPTEFEQAVLATLETGGSVVTGLMEASADMMLRKRIDTINPNVKVHVRNDPSVAKSWVWVSRREKQ